MAHRGDVGQITGWLSPFLEHVRLRQAARATPPAAAILDIGCGRARLLDYVAPPRSYTGLDVLPSVVARNRSAHPHHRFLLADAQTHDLSSLGSFDAIVMAAVIEHFTRPGLVLGRLSRLLTPGGCVIVTTPHPRGESILQAGVGLRLCSPEAGHEHQPLLHRDELLDLAAASGLRLLRYRTFLFGLNQLAVFGKEGERPQ